MGSQNNLGIRNTGVKKVSDTRLELNFYVVGKTKYQKLKTEVTTKQPHFAKNMKITQDKVKLSAKTCV